MRAPRTLRGRLTALAMLAALVAVATLTVTFNVVLARILESDAKDRLRSQAAAAATTLASRGGKLVVREAADDRAVDGRLWVFEGHRAVERPVAHPDLQRAAADIAARPGGFVVLRRPEVRLYALRARIGDTTATIVVAEPTEPYDRTTDLALLGSIVFGALLLAIVFLMTRIVVLRALGPVEQMTQQAAEWTERQPERRFGSIARPDELSRLAQTFDALLDRLAASMRHEQRFSAELSHELRTPLARIMAETDLLARRERTPEEHREANAAIARSAEQMSAILETLMKAARADSGLERGRAELGVALPALAGEWREAFARDGVELDVAVSPPTLVAGVDREVLDRVLAPILDNARRYARSRVVMGARAADGAVAITVRDDGPGIAAAEQAGVFEPGARGASADEHAGAGLGLALARRLARAVGGDVVVVEAGGAAGAEFRVTLPA